MTDPHGFPVNSAANSSEVIHIAEEVSLPPERVWELLADAAHRDVWWGTHVELELRRGGPLRERWSNGKREVLTTGSVVRCGPPSFLELTWRDDDWPADTSVLIQLFRSERGTTVVLEHGGWSAQPEEKRESLVVSHRRGWSEILGRLREYATTLDGRGASK